MDETIISWDGKSKELVHIFEGHEGSITAIGTSRGLLVSASADVTMRLWSIATGTPLRLLYGHSKSVLSLELGENWLLTGSADEDARVWTVHRKSDVSVTAITSRRLSGHDHPVTCVRYGSLEVVTGDNVGRIFVWWLATGQILRKCEAHKGMVKSLHFDAVHVLSGGVDHNVAITDLATGEVMQTLRGHDNHVLFVSFDSERLISISADNTIRLCKWGSNDAKPDKYHTLGEGESLMHVSKVSGVGVDELMRWNDIRDTRQLHAGMRLVVAKGDPDELTKAEKLALARERRLIGRARKGGVQGSLLSPEDAALLNPSSIQLYLQSIDNVTSLGNRMFGQEKKDKELFSSILHSAPTTMNIATRLQRENYEKTRHMPLRGCYPITAGNVDEWGDIADNVMLTMIHVFIEYQIVLLAQSLNYQTTSHLNVLGRMRNDGTRPPSRALLPLTTLDKVEEEDEKAQGGEESLC